MKKQEPKAAELAQNARKNMNDAAEATRKAAGDASAKISKLMGSSPEPSFDESGAMAREDAAPSESRLDKLKAAFKPKENPEVGALRAEVAELRARSRGSRRALSIHISAAASTCYSLRTPSPWGEERREARAEAERVAIGRPPLLRGRRRLVGPRLLARARAVHVLPTVFHR